MRVSARSLSILLPLAVPALAMAWILGSGYLPPDDVLRHSAFATTQRTWDQILVGRPEALFDQSPGWHAFLRLLHHLTGASPEGLAVFSIFFCFMLFLAVGLLWVRRWEAWVLTLAVFFWADGALVQRLALGRPFLVTESLVLCLLGSLRTPRREGWGARRQAGWLLAGLVATWVHGSWYLLFLVPACLAPARRWRELAQLAVALGAGCLLGAALTGHPLRFLGGETAHLLSALGQPAPVRSLAMEFLPGGRDQSLLIPVCVVLLAIWKGCSGRRAELSRDGVLLLGGAAWLLGCFWVWRFYLDWAFPALALWTAWGVEEALEGMPPVRFGGVLAPFLASGLFLLSVCPDRGGRWSIDGPRFGLDPGKAADRALLPEPGGVLYSDSMFVFFGTYFLNPEGRWRYVLGYEPGLMTPGDRQVYQLACTGVAPSVALAPWIGRMTSKDRLVLLGAAAVMPPIPGIQWAFSPPCKWVGRKTS